MPEEIISERSYLDKVVFENIGKLFNEDINSIDMIYTSILEQMLLLDKMFSLFPKSQFLRVEEIRKIEQFDMLIQLQFIIFSKQLDEENDNILSKIEVLLEKAEEFQQLYGEKNLSMLFKSIKRFFKEQK